MRLETKPGKSFASAGVFPRSSARATIAAAVSSDVCSAADHLDELQDGHRVEEVHPDDLVRPARDRGERGDRDRRRVRREDGLGRKRLVRTAEDRLLHRRVLDDGLDEQVGRNEIVDRGDAREHLVGCRSALLGELAEALLHARERALDGARHLVVERDAAPGRCDDLRDAAAHLARADDEDVLEAHAAQY